MLDSTRPKSSKFLQIFKQLLIFDKSLKRIINHPGGKNISTIFGYIASKSFDLVLLQENQHKKVGKNLFGDKKWLDANQFLTAMEWGGDDDKPTNFSINLINELFQSFVEDGGMKSKKEGASILFQLSKILNYPSNNEIDKARQSNKYLMSAIDDILKFLPKTLDKGSPSHDPTKSLYSPLWEAYDSDPLNIAFEDELIYQTIENLPEKIDANYNILFMGVRVGNSVNQLLDALCDKYSNTCIKLVAIDNNNALLQKAKNIIHHHIDELRPDFPEKNIEIDIKTKAQAYNARLTESKKYNLIICSHTLMYISKKGLVGYFDNLSSSLVDDGLLTINQSTSYSKEYPYPLTPMFRNLTNFKGFPTKENIKHSASSFFKNIKSTGLDAIWVFRQPVKY